MSKLIPKKFNWDCPTKLREITIKETCDYIKEKYHVDVSYARLRRWICHGVVSYDGHKIFLQAKKRAGWVTTRHQIDMFIKEQEKQKQKTTQDIKISRSASPQKLISLLAAQKYIKREYQRDISLPTLRNWCTKGRISNSGRRFILQARKQTGIYRGWHVKIKWINAYICELDS